MQPCLYCMRIQFPGGEHGHGQEQSSVSEGSERKRFLRSTARKSCARKLFGGVIPKASSVKLLQYDLCRLHHRPRVLQCNRCRSQSSLISGSIFACTKLPLTTWFLALHLLTVSKTGLSAMELHRQLGVNYNTAWMVKHKLLQAMKEADDRHPLHGIIQLDDAYWGGERRGGKRGRGRQARHLCSGSCSERSWTPDSHAHDGRFWFQNQRDRCLG